MAREIKITINRNGEFGVRNIPDSLAINDGEVVIAARWQDKDGVKIWFLDEGAKSELLFQAGALGASASLHDLKNYVRKNYGDATNVIREPSTYFRVKTIHYSV